MPQTELEGKALFVPVPVQIPVERIIVQGLAPEPTEKPAPGGAQEIRAEGGDSALGVTMYPIVAPPAFSATTTRQPTGRWSAQVTPVPIPGQRFTSWYPGPGIHRLDVQPPRYMHFPASISEQIKQGEQEHIHDFVWANHLALVRPAQEINTLASGPAIEGANALDAVERARQALRSALPPQLRWPPAAEPSMYWLRVYGDLAQVTKKRDDDGWHTLSGAYVVDPEKRRLGVPRGAVLVRYLRDGEIGRHDPEELVRARFNALAGTP